MPSPAPDRRANRTALAREARRLAEEIENLYIQLAQTGDVRTIRQFMIRHSEGVPNFDFLHTAKALRCYAGVLLSMVPTTLPKPADKPQ